MRWTNTPNRFGIMAQIFHWTTVLAVGLAWALGQFGDEIPKGIARQTAGFIHVSAGELIAILLIGRLIWRQSNPYPTKISSPLSKWGEYAGSIMHFVLYVLLATVVLAGITTEFAQGKPLTLFGLYEVASPWVKDKQFAHSVKEIHETLANSLIVLATIHAGSALVHHYMFKNNTLKRMFPFWSE